MAASQNPEAPWLASLSVADFQSLRSIQLELARFTVIVGPSSSGKSALVRAIRLLLQNKRGSDFISHGAKTTAISAKIGDHAVAISRSRDSSAALNWYELDGERYTKLGGEVPAAVSAASRVDPKNLIQIAGQFDKPYLLAESSGEAARAIGALTGIETAIEAAREGNRRKLRASQELKLKASDLDAVRARIPEFKRAKQMGIALDAAEGLLEQAYGLQRKISELRRALEEVKALRSAVSGLEKRAIAPDPSEAVELMGKVKTLRTALSDARTALESARQHKAALAMADEILRSEKAREQELRKELGADVEALMIGAGVRDSGLAAEVAVDWAGYGA